MLVKNVGVDDEIGVSSGMKTPRQSYDEIVILDNSLQEWENDYLYPVLPKLDENGIFENDVNVDTSYGDATISPITDLNEVDENLILDIEYNIPFGTTEDIIDKTEINKIEYNQDFQLSLDENLRLKIDTLIIPDGIETEKSEQAF